MVYQYEQCVLEEAELVAKELKRPVIPQRRLTPQIEVGSVVKIACEIRYSCCRECSRLDGGFRDSVRCFFSECQIE
jgi:hypothetical protein